MVNTGAPPNRKNLFEQGPIVLFDGECGLCSWSLRFFLAHEDAKTFFFAPMQSPAGQTALRRLGLPLSEWNSFVVLYDNTPYFRSQGVFVLCNHMVKPWRWLRVGRYLPPSVTDVLYLLIAKYRYRILGRSDSCGSDARFAGRLVV
jgi:predicted DCC family thiol-disulfide oxidoreductase YuxK